MIVFLSQKRKCSSPLLLGAFWLGLKQKKKVLDKQGRKTKFFKTRGTACKKDLNVKTMSRLFLSVVSLNTKYL